jgi:hypothetical protein
VIGLGRFNIIVVIVTRIKWVDHVGRRGWRRITLMAAGGVMTSRHDDRNGGGRGEGERRRERGLKSQVE